MNQMQKLSVQKSWLCTTVRSNILDLDNVHKHENIINEDNIFLGLFANIDFAENEEIGTYYGDILKTTDAIKLKDKSYLMRLGEQCYVNANENYLSCEMRYINDCRNPAGYNVKFIKCPELCLAKVITLRPIKRHEEMFVNYGKFYWIGATITPTRLSFRELHQLKLICCQSDSESNTESV